jgi:hypothetical protein
MSARCRSSANSINLGGHPAPAHRTGAEATEMVPELFRVRLPGDLSLIVFWTAGVMQLLLLFDPRYRDSPLPVFIVPQIATLARGLLGD